MIVGNNSTAAYEAALTLRPSVSGWLKSRELARFLTLTVVAASAESRRETDLSIAHPQGLRQFQDARESPCEVSFQPVKQPGNAREMTTIVCHRLQGNLSRRAGISVVITPVSMVAIDHGSIFPPVRSITDAVT